MSCTDRHSSGRPSPELRSGTRRGAALPLAALLLALSCTSAHAQVSASSSLSNIRFETFDLRPDDGVTGGYEMNPDNSTKGYWYQTSSVRRERPSDGKASFSDDGDSYGDATHVAAPSEAGYSGSATHDPASGYSSQAQLSYKGEISASAYSDLAAYWDLPQTEDSWAGLRLDPYTSLTISFDAAVAANDMGWMDGVMTSASAYAYARWLHAGDSSTHMNSFSILDVRTLHDGKADNFAKSQRLELTITNNGSDYLVGSLGLNSGVTVAAIPEPSTYALFAAGLGALGWATRRRRGASPGAVQRTA